MLRPLALALLLTVSPLLAGCASDPIVTPASEMGPRGFASWTDEPPVYLLGAGDEFEVKLAYTPEFNERVTIAPDGQVSLPIAGPVAAAGRTVPELKVELDRLYNRTLRAPDVQVLVRGFASQRVFVGGEVNSPGIYPIPGRVGIAEIVMLANGFRDTARQDSVVLIRRRSDGLPMLRVVNVSRFMGGQDGGDIPLSGSDIVFVPKSSIAEVNLFIEQYVNRVLPFNRNFSYTINRNTGNGAAVVNGTPTVTTQ